MVDINCDMGEGIANDASLMRFITSANIACGYHAGNEDTIRTTIDNCIQFQAAIGAHPSFDDKKNFGRTEIVLPANEIADLVTAQLQIIKNICNEKKAKMHHVKPHGALYNMAARDAVIASAIAAAVVAFDNTLLLYGLSGSHLITEGDKAGLKTISEVFADRSYQADGSLTPRSQSNALLHSNDDAVKQVLQMIRQQKVTATNGKLIDIKAETICIHGDGENAVDIAKHLYETLSVEGIAIKTF